MGPVPSKTAEAIVGALIPAACREEILGDLHERYISPRQYGLEALRTIPLVIVSRMRRTADPQVLLMQVFAWYVSFLGAAWLQDRAFLNAPLGLVRLAIPAGMAILALILEDAYAKVPRPAKALARGPLLGIGFALASQGIFRIGNPELAVPGWIAFYGSATGFLMSCAVRMLFPPGSQQLQGAKCLRAG
jgi:hypothetical protein